MEPKELAREAALKMAKRKRGVAASELSEKLGRGTRGNGPLTRVMKGLVVKGDLKQGDDGRFYASGLPDGVEEVAQKPRAKNKSKSNDSKMKKQVKAPVAAYPCLDEVDCNEVAADFFESLAARLRA